MKQKLLAMAALVVTAFTAQAQEGDSAYKPLGGAKTLEATIRLDGAYGGNIKFRKFNTENIAFRHNLHASLDRSKVTNDGFSTGFTLGYVPGIEKHFAGTNRLSPYIGLELPLFMKHSSYKDSEIEVKNAGGYSGNSSYNRAYYAAGINGLAGADYYVAKNFYVGIEAGIGIRHQKYRDTKVYHTNSAMPAQTIEGYGSTSVSTFTSGGIRVGFVF